MATVALVHSHARPAFNATFYATVAVIIPVLYLALVVQGGGVDALARQAAYTFNNAYQFTLAVRRVLLRRTERPGFTTVDLAIMAVALAFVSLMGAVFAVAMTIVSFLIAVAGGVSELCALYALYKQDAVLSIAPSLFGPNHDSVNLSYIVLAGTGILIAATTVLPIAQLLARVRAGVAEPSSKSPTEGNPLPDDAR